MLSVILLAICLGLIIARMYHSNLKYRDFYKLKGPTPIPLLGNALLFCTPAAELFETQLRLTKEYGEIYRLIIGPEKVVALSKPEHLELILTSVKHIKKSSNYDLLQNWLGNGLVNSSGNYWRKHRKIITPTFHFKSLQEYSVFMTKNLKTLRDNLKAKSPDVLNITQYVKLYALDTICESALRFHFNAQANAESDYVKSLRRYLQIHMRRFFSLFLRIPILFSLSGLRAEQDKCVKCMSSYTDEVITRRKHERSEQRKQEEQMVTTRNDFDEKPMRSFVDLLLDKQYVENVFTDSEIREEVTTFMFAGHDTVSSAISFTLYELAIHPEVQQQLVEESYELMPPGKEIEVNCANINALRLLDRVIKECMRIHTTVPLIERELEEDIKLDGLHIPAGVTIQIQIYSLHNNEKYYPDPRKFDPERFSAENSKKRHPYAYIPFSAGPRNCIGYKYALLMTKATVINILRNFEVSRPKDSKYEPILYNNAILESTNGVHICLQERN